MHDMTRISLWGMYQYMPDLFDGVVVPNGFDRNIVIDEIIERSGDLYPYYQVPQKLKENITHWFQARYDNLDRIYRALYAEYNPIENYDRHEESTESPDLLHTTTTSDNIQSNGNSNESGSSSNNSTTEGFRSAYDTYDYSPNTREITNATAQGNNDLSSTQTTQSTRKEDISEKGSKSFKSRIHGNIGVTTSAQMIEGELNLRKINLYEMIASEFEDKFLIQVY